MKLPLEWLREQIPTSLTDEQIAERLTATGIAVEKVITRGIADTPRQPRIIPRGQGSYVRAAPRRGPPARAER